jgi:hypothetical protein
MVCRIMGMEKHDILKSRKSSNGSGIIFNLSNDSSLFFMIPDSLVGLCGGTTVVVARL